MPWHIDVPYLDNWLFDWISDAFLAFLHSTRAVIVASSILVSLGAGFTGSGIVKAHRELNVLRHWHSANVTIALSGDAQRRELRSAGFSENEGYGFVATPMDDQSGEVGFFLLHSRRLSDYNAWRPGTTIEVLFDPQNPALAIARSHLPRYPLLAHGRTWFGLFLALMGAASLLLIGRRLAPKQAG